MELAGDKMTVSTDREGTTRFRFDDKGTGRQCGSCQLCCRLVPVPDIGKQAGVRCRHQKFGVGCAVYADRPSACRLWSCRWLSDPETAGMPRPDRAHYVIDVMPDFVTLTFPDEAKVNIPVVQVWVDPAHRNAYQSRELRAYMLKMAVKHGLATIVRWSRADAITVFPPPLSDGKKWHEQSGSLDPRNAAERMEAMQLGEDR